MQIHPRHPWTMTQTEAVALQRQLASQIDTTPPVTAYDTIAGADVSYNRFSDVFYAVVVVLRAKDAEVLEVQYAVRTSTFPYIPGLLSFREAPALLDAFAKVQTTPDVVMIDGQGIAHPRGMGIAAHIGLWLEVPCIGCGKSKLCGQYADLGEEPSSQTPLIYHKAVIGTVLRTKRRSNPLFISPGHRIDMASSVRIAQEMCRGYRVPEPTRQAHLHVNAYRREHPEAEFLTG
jgi:deoxyribonuclease V